MVGTRFQKALSLLPFFLSFFFFQELEMCLDKWSRERWCKGMLLLLLSRFSCFWLCDPIDSSPSGSCVPWIFQARTLEWVSVSFSNAWKWKVKVKSLSRVRLLATPWTTAYQAPLPMVFSRQEYWSGLPLPSPGVKV